MLITAPFVKKYAVNSYNSEDIETCKYYALGAKKYTKFMKIKSTQCGCADYKIVKAFFYIEKAEQQILLHDCKKNINTALNWLDKVVKTLTICK